MSSHWLESLYWISQILLTIIAMVAATAAFVQIRTTKLFELLRYIESSELRKARRVVFLEIRPRKNEEWWKDEKDGERLEGAASDVCAAYDILGKLIENDWFESILPSYGRFFTRYWKPNIRDHYDALEMYIRYRRERVPEAYSSFTTLAATARAAMSVDKEKVS